MGRDALQTPRRVGRYAFHDAIAAGGMATVHLGILLGPAGFRRPVAGKRLHEQFAHDPSFVAMFLDEARMASRVRHPNVVVTLDVVEEDDEVWLVMEYIAGEALSKLIHFATVRGERIPLDVAVAIGSGMLHGLHAAHEARDDHGEPMNLVHRDVSPQNVLVGVDGSPRLVDFGVAKATGRSQVTREGQLKGKMPYMAPEQIRGQASRQSDVWAASVVLWEMLTGQRLFDGDSEGHIYSRIMNEKAPAPSARARGVPRSLDGIVLRGLQRAPERRFATAREMALALELCISPATPARVGNWVEMMAGERITKRANRLAALERSEAVTAVPATVVTAPRSSVTKRLGIVAAAAIAVGGVSVLAWAARPAGGPRADAELGSIAPVVERFASEGADVDGGVSAEPTPVAEPASDGTGSARPATSSSPGVPVKSTKAVSRSGGKTTRPPPSATARGDGCRYLDSAGVWHVRPECL